MEEGNSPAHDYVNNSLAVPSAESAEQIYNQVSIIRGLSTENDLQKIELRLRGYTFNFLTGKWVKIRQPIMNETGIGNFMACLQGVGDNMNFSYLDEKQIPKLAKFFVGQNYPHFKLYADNFGLAKHDENVVLTIMFGYFLSILQNARNAGHRNVVRGTLSENVLMRGLSADKQEPKKSGLFGFFGGGRR